MGNPRMEPASAVTSAVTSVADLSGTTVGRFAIHELLGKGGMGEVYRASDTRLKRQVALKRIAPNHRNDEHSRDRLWKEAEWASRLSDSHIAAVYDVIEEENELFIVMEYVDGQTFRRRLAKPIPVAEFLPIATECALALAAAHKAGVLHRDIKPENIMLTTSGHVKVLDFGVAKNLPGGIEIKTLSTRASAEFAGTLIYMAPEVVQEKDSDARADIFSLGIVFYETIAGCNPFRAETFLETCNRILYHEPLPSHELNPTSPAELDRIVAKMIAKDPAQMYSTAADLAVDLNSLQLTLSQSGVAVPQRLPVPKRKRTVMWATGLTAAFLAATAFIAPVRQQFKSWLSASPMPHAKQVAVLPFSIVGGDAQTAALGAGLAETLTAKLTQLTSDPSLQVVPATEIRAKHITTVDDARKEFGANLVLEGSLHKSGQQIRVNYILVDARTRRQMRAESVTLAEVDSFAAEDAVVNGAIQMLELEIRGGQRQALENHGTEVAGAYDYYLQGRGYLQNYDRVENLDSAIQVFERALTLDRNYALAYAGLGDAYWKKYSSSKEPAWIEKSRTACQQANHLDGKMSSAYACLGTLSSGTGNYQEAAQEFGRAAESEPTNDGAFRGLADAYEHLGKLEEAEKTYRRVIGPDTIGSASSITVKRDLVKRARCLTRSSRSHRTASSVIPTLVLLSWSRRVMPMPSWLSNARSRSDRTTTDTPIWGTLTSFCAGMKKPIAPMNKRQSLRKKTRSSGGIWETDIIGHQESAGKLRPHIGGRSPLRRKTSASIRRMGHRTAFSRFAMRCSGRKSLHMTPCSAVSGFHRPILRYFFRLRWLTTNLDSRVKRSSG
jgi:TolB-like protein/tRNA A-37 threonylcarbamoyl transferase component Bud32